MTDRPLDPAELALLLATDGLGPEVTGAGELRALGPQLREATAVALDVADDVMLAVALNEALAGRIDVADEVMVGVQLADALATPVELADDIMLAIQLKDALAQAPGQAEIDVADDVMLAVELNAALRPPTTQVGVADRAVDVADAVMAQIGEQAVAMPRWASLGVLGGGAGLAALAMAAALLLAVFGPWSGTAPQGVTAEIGAPMLTLAQFNEAEVEDLVVADGSTAQVMQFEEGGPTIIFVEEES